MSASLRKSLFTVSALLLLCAVMVASCQKEESDHTKTVSDVETGSVASTDGVMINYEIRGEGETALVFTHCWSCDRSYWSEQVDVFSKAYRVVTIDLAGHGESGLGRQNWTIESFGADVAAVVEHLELQKVVLIGHSMGGPVNVAAAGLLGDRVTGIVGVDTYHTFESDFTEEQIDGFLATFKADFPVATAGFVRAMFPEGADTSLVNRVSLDMASAPPEVALSAFENYFAYDMVGALKEVKATIKCVNSDRYPTETESNRKHNPGFDVKLMPGTGHFIMQEKPAEFNALLEETLESFLPRP